MLPRRLTSALLLSIIPSMLLAGTAHAQGVTGRVVEEGSGAPVSGAFVAVVDGDGRGPVGGLTGTDGGFFLRLPRAGRYRLRVDRIGYRTAATELFEVRKGEVVTREMAVFSTPLPVGRLEVQARGRCVLRPDEGEPTWRLWSEARKALELTRWTESQRDLRFALIRFERTVDADGMVVRSETAELAAAMAERPFQSDAPERLRRLGYVRGDRRERDYFLPDARVLLSDAFLDSHCFRRVGHDQGGSTGLAFEPVDPRARSDVEGTLWLDARTGELRSLEVRYVNPGLPGPIEAGRVGGEAHFQRLPDGAWIVSRWRIRMASFHRTGLLGLRIAIHHFVEVESEVLAVETAAGETIPYERAAAALSGVARDPATGHPLKGANVALAGTPYRTTTDSGGRFLLRGLPGHRYRLVIDHPLLDPGSPPTQLTLVRGETVHLEPGDPPT